MFTVFFFCRSCLKDNQRSQIGICFRVFLSLHVRTGLECSDVLHGKVAETSMNRALLANFVSANFPSRDICGFEEFCDSLSTRSYLRDAKSKHQKVPKKTLQNPKATSLPVQRILSTKRTLWPDSPGGAPSLMAWDCKVWNFVALEIMPRQIPFCSLHFLLPQPLAS